MALVLDGLSDGIGEDTGSVPILIRALEVVITWQFPPTAPDPDWFEVLAHTGSDPADTAAWLWQPVEVPGTQRSYCQTITPQSTVSAIHAAVRAVYAS